MSNKSYDTPQSLSDGLMAMMVGLMIYPIIESLLGKDLSNDGYIRNHKIWITSPSGKTTAKFPFYQALRIVRKRGWTLTEVEPLKKLSRWTGLRLFITGRLCE